MTAPLWSLTATGLAAGYAAGTFSPADALRSVLARLDAVNPVLNAIIAVDRDGAMQAASEAAERWRTGAPLSPLDGVPVSIKDNLFAAGLPANWGSRLHAGFMPDQDEPAVARLRAAGCVLFGKTNVPEFTVQGYTSNRVFGTSFNPHAPGNTPGGSTGGGAAAVAAGIGPLAIGTDAGGSLRRPAAHCGLFALKPSIGQVARHGGFPQLVGDFEVIGALARTPEDLQAVHAILSGYDPADARTLAACAMLPEFPASPRIAYLPRIGANPVDPRIAACAQQLAAALADAGCTVETIEAPYDPDRLAAAWGIVASTGLACHLASLPDWHEQVSPSVRAMAEQGGRYRASELFDALAFTAQARSAAGTLFSHHDLILSPATAALAWPAEAVFPPQIDGREVGPRGHAVFTGWVNLAGLPAMTIPVAMTPAQGGIGMQFTGAHGRDRDLLALAATHPALRPFAPAPLASMETTA
jgi:aspartyl-tRNA(Asn)/glutamyl-tRNA(Gln) amidotransferase subunit A